MSEDLIPDPDQQTELELLNLGGARQLALDLVQLIEGKALAQRLAFKVLVQELSAAAGPDVALRIQAQLDAAMLDPAMLGESDDTLRNAVAQELSSLVEMLNDLASASRSAVGAEPRIQMS